MSRTLIKSKRNSQQNLPHPLIRDLRIIMRIILVVIYYWTVGWLVRRRYAWLQKHDRTYYVDIEQKRGIWDWKREEDIR